MERQTILLLLLLPILTFHSISTTNTAAVAAVATTALNPATTFPSSFIKSECLATRYSSLCIKCLSNYSTTIQQNPLKLAQTALSVSLSRAQSAASFTARLAKVNSPEQRIVQDCAQNLDNAVDQLSRSERELAGVQLRGGQDFGWHIGNTRTWVSTALTNQNTCLEGFRAVAGRSRLKVSVQRVVVESAQVTSNALALVYRFAARHRNNVDKP